MLIRSRGRARKVSIVLTGALCVVLAACSSSSKTATTSTSSTNAVAGGDSSSSAGASDSGGATPAGGTLTVGMPTSPNSLDPTTAGNGLPLTWYTVLGYDSLIKRAVDGTPQPGLALSWKYSTDRLSFVMELRPNVKFTDGETMTAADVVAWLEHYKKSGTFTAWLANVGDMKATGPLEVTLTLSSPDPLLPLGFDQSGIAGDVVGPKGLAAPASLGTSSDGAGPYMLDPAQTIANSSYVWVKNPAYWNPSAQYWSKVVLKVFTDPNSLLSALRSGQVQVALGDAANAEAAKSAGLNVTAATSAWVGAYFGDIDGTVTPQFKDPRVRQAMNYAIDRKGITKTVYGDYGMPTDQMVPAQIGGYVADLENQYPYDPAKAKQLLADAGYPNGFSFKLLVQPGINGGDLLAQAMVQQWKQIGINATLNSPAAFGDYVTALTTSKQYSMTTLNFNNSAQLVDTQELVTKPALYNYLGYTDAKANELAAAQRKYDVTSPEGIKAAQDSETYMVQRAFMVPVTSIQAVLFSTKSVTGTDFNAAFSIPDPTRWKPAS